MQIYTTLLSTKNADIGNMDVVSLDYRSKLFVDKVIICGEVLKSVQPNIFHHQGMWPISLFDENLKND